MAAAGAGGARRSRAARRRRIQVLHRCRHVGCHGLHPGGTEMRVSKSRLATCAVVAPLLAPPVPSVRAADRLTDRPFAMRSPVVATHGMVACAHPLATQI